ncbi:MAG TPA: hypothetical protein VFT82_04180 [Candidatus Paceibacterota bacterium]|nr:hypothetical protein [Candidatus Paceibacterota bacterium]
MIFGKRKIMILLLAALALPFLLGSAGIAHIGMDMGMNGMGTGDCPFAPGTSLCTMTPIEHVGAAQSLFTSLPPAYGFALLALFMFALAGMAAVALLSFSISPPAPLRFLFATEFAHAPPRSLQEAFSRGILHSKAF